VQTCEKSEAENRTPASSGVPEAIATSGGGSRQASRAGGCARRGDEDLKINLAGIVTTGVCSVVMITIDHFRTSQVDGRDGENSHHPPR
jgi:hypothetical protein